jgi:glutathione synthase/RimK-type ligase-like ATP-grasp enzyme
MLMRAFRLENAGIDFRLTAEGAYVFLEVNTAGEFLYVQDRTGQPTAEAMAAHLAGGKPTHSSSAPWVPPARTSPGGAP